MDAYDEIFDFFGATQEQKIACLKHLLNSTRAKLPSSTKGKIYDRVTDFDAPRNIFVQPIQKFPDEDAKSETSDTDSKVESRKIKNKEFSSVAAEELAESYGYSVELLKEFATSNNLDTGKKNKITKNIVIEYHTKLNN